MSTLSLLGVGVTLVFVLGLLAVALRLVRRIALGGTGGRGGVPLEVVQRLALGPKQGIAVVRIGERLLAVSLGEGGIRPLVELGDAAQLRAGGDAATPSASTTTSTAAGATPRRAALLSPLRPVAAMTAVDAPATPATPAPSDFRALLRTAVRGGTAAVLGALLLAAAAPVLHAQAAAAPAAAAVDPAALPDVTQGAADTSRGFRVAPEMAWMRTRGRVERPVGPAARAATRAAAVLAQDQPPAATEPTQQAPAAQAPAPAPAPAQAPVQAPAQAPTTAAPAPTPAVVQATAAAGATAPTAMTRAEGVLERLAPSMDLRVGEEQGGLRLSGTVGVVIMMGLLTLLPTLLLMMTGFTRILIVLHFLRQALGTQSAPPSHLIAGLALLLTGFVMAPTLREVNQSAIDPWLAGSITQEAMLSTGVQPFREFMLRQTRDSDIRAFLDLSDAPEPATVDDVPLVVVVSAFVTSELRTAFQIGFALFLPFIVIDVVVSAVLMSMGMFMLPPAMISLPFKLLLFVLVDGWTLLVQSLITSFK